MIIVPRYELFEDLLLLVKPLSLNKVAALNWSPVVIDWEETLFSLSSPL